MDDLTVSPYKYSVERSIHYIYIYYSHEESGTPSTAAPMCCYNFD